MPVEDSAREVREELLRGTGAVMAEGCSIFMETGNIRDQMIIVARCPDSENSAQSASFDINHLGEAWKLFVQWRKSP